MSKSFTIRLTYDMTCPHCGAKQDSLTSEGDLNGEISPGHVAVCIRCAAVNIVTETWQLRKMTNEEFNKIRLEDPAGFNLIMRLKFEISKLPGHN